MIARKTLTEESSANTAKYANVNHRIVSAALLLLCLHRELFVNHNCNLYTHGELSFLPVCWLSDRCGARG